METLNYKVLEGTGYNGYILKDAPVKVMQFGEGNFLRAFVDYFYRYRKREGWLQRQGQAGAAHRQLPPDGRLDQRAGGSVHPVPARQREGPEGGRKAGDLLRVRLRVPLHR